MRAGPPARAFLALGSNLGDRAAHLQAAVDGLARHPDVEVVAVSPVYETDPVGGPPQDDFLNAVVEVRTILDPLALLELGLGLEAEAHRVRRQRWGPRTLDVDVLVYDDVRRQDGRLTLPHPRMAERAFVLAPLADIAPDVAQAAAGPPPVGGWPGVRRAAATLTGGRQP